MDSYLNVEFDSSPNKLNSYAKRVGLARPSEADLQMIYSRSGGFLLQRRDELVARHGWVPVAHNENMLFVLEKENPSDYDYGLGFQALHDVSRLQLPVFIADMLDTWEAEEWKKMFYDTNIFNPYRQDQTNGRSIFAFKDCPSALSDLFYFIQVLVPGLLAIVDANRENVAPDDYQHVLPNDQWIERQKGSLQHIFGAARYSDLLLEAAKATQSGPDEPLDPRCCGQWDSQPRSLIQMSGKFGTSFHGAQCSLPWAPDEEMHSRSPSPQRYTIDDKEFGYCDDWIQ
ncbi:hypothetical protein AAF712_000272 [Marasmius tenuissimus]|uniref:Uncharacterized protein n=1 Tax=Marasmius tenuissimus TaxID=585030 RepID=A0ABR3AGF2_9AGAR